MIAVIRVALTRGVFMSGQHLRDLIATIYQHEEQPAHRQRAQGILQYVADIVAASVYTFIPSPASQAAVLWLTESDFEIVVETFHKGHLIRCANNIVKVLLPSLKQKGYVVGITISVLKLGDSQTYIIGEPNSFFERLWDNLKDNLIALFVGMIIAIIAKVWLTQYYEESLAIVIGLSLFTGWEILAVWLITRRKPIHWRINE